MHNKFDDFFNDLKVVELASVLAGPAVGMFFSELGAKVIKIENKNTGGDVTRKWKLPTEDPASKESAYFYSVNWNKEHLFLDLYNKEDQGILKEIIKGADVVVSNFKPSSAVKMGMDYKSIQAINPKVIFAELMAFGNHEPDRPAFDVILQAEAGFLFMSGYPGGEEVKMPVALIDVLAAHQLKEAILMAYIHRLRTGEGSYVQSSLLEAAVTSLVNQASNYLNEGFIPNKMGTLHPNIAPYGETYYTKDRKKIILGVGTQKQFLSLCINVGLDSIKDDPRFIDNPTRLKYRKQLNDLLLEAFSNYLFDDIYPLLVEAKVPIGLVKNMAEVLNQPFLNHLILKGKTNNKKLHQRLKTVAFVRK